MGRAPVRRQKAEGFESVAEMIAIAQAAQVATAIALPSASVDPPQPPSSRPDETQQLDFTAIAGPNLERAPWMLHETELLRRPVYRSEQRSLDDTEASGSYFDQPIPEHLPLLKYNYDGDTELLTRIGELNTRDMLVMAVIQHAFYSADCPADGRIEGDHATLGYIAKQIDMNPEGSTGLIRASLERLSTAKVRLKLRERRISTGYPTDGKGEVVFGFLAGFGARDRSVRGVSTDRSNYIQLDPVLAGLIRKGNFTFLSGRVLRALRRQPLALRLYAWARSHRPNDRGTLMPHSVDTLAHKLGCSDTNPTRRRRKVEAALDAVCAAASDEFPRYESRVGRAHGDQVITLHRSLATTALPAAAAV